MFQDVSGLETTRERNISIDDGCTEPLIVGEVGQLLFVLLLLLFLFVQH